MEENAELIHAVKNKKKELIDKLIKKGENVNKKDGNGKTPLMYAAEQGDEETARLLINHGADVHAKNGEGKTAASFAAINGYERMMKILHPEKQSNEEYKKYNREKKIQEAVFNMSISLLAFFVIAGLIGAVIYIYMTKTVITILYPFFIALALAFIYDVVRRAFTKFIINNKGVEKDTILTGGQKFIEWNEIDEIILDTYSALLSNGKKKRILIYAKDGSNVKIPDSITDFEKAVNLIKTKHTVVER